MSNEACKKQAITYLLHYRQWCSGALHTAHKTETPTVLSTKSITALEAAIGLQWQIANDPQILYDICRAAAILSKVQLVEIIVLCSD